MAAVIFQAFVIFITEVSYKSSLPVAIFANCANLIAYLQILHKSSTLASVAFLYKNLLQWPCLCFPYASVVYYISSLRNVLSFQNFLLQYFDSCTV